MIEPEDAARARQALGEVDFAAAIYAYYAENGPALMADESSAPFSRDRFP